MRKEKPVSSPSYDGFESLNMSDPYSLLFNFTKAVFIQDVTSLLENYNILWAYSLLPILHLAS